MKTIFNPILFFLAFTIFYSCEIIPPEDDSNHSTPGCDINFKNESIIGGGVNTYLSYRNNHYKFEITKPNTVVTFKCNITGTDGRIYLLNSAKTYIQYSNSGSIANIDNYNFTDVGTYYLVVNGESTGTYNLEVCGDVKKFKRIENEKLEFKNQSIETGGGINSYLSWRNSRYSFEVVKDNTIVDFLAKSTTANLRIYILNSAGQYIQYSNSGVNENLSEYSLSKGLYFININTESEKTTNFDLSLYFEKGNVINLRAVPSSKFTAKSGTIAKGGGIDAYNSNLNKKYAFTIIEDSYIDLVGKSSGLNTRIYLLNSAGNYIDYSNSGVVANIEQKYLTKGNYFVVVCGDLNKSGSYTIRLHGKAGAVTDLIPQ